MACHGSGGSAPAGVGVTTSNRARTVTFVLLTRDILFPYTSDPVEVSTWLAASRGVIRLRQWLV